TSRKPKSRSRGVPEKSVRARAPTSLSFCQIEANNMYDSPGTRPQISNRSPNGTSPSRKICLHPPENSDNSSDTVLSSGVSGKEVKPVAQNVAVFSTYKSTPSRCSE